MADQVFVRHAGNSVACADAREGINKAIVVSAAFGTAEVYQATPAGPQLIAQATNGRATMVEAPPQPKAPVQDTDETIANRIAKGLAGAVERAFLARKQAR